MIIFRFILGLFNGTVGFIVGICIFALIVLMTAAKSMGILKNVVWPFYSGSLPEFGSVVFMLISIISFVWLMHKNFIHNRPVLTSMAIGLTLTGIMGLMTPYVNVGTYIGDRIGIALDIDSSKAQAGVHAVKGITGYDPRDAVKIFETLPENYLENEQLPFAAFAYEVSSIEEHKEKSKRLWMKYRAFLKNQFPNEDSIVNTSYEGAYMKAVNGYYASYFKTLFKDKEEVMKKRELLVIAHMTKLGIETDADQELSDRMYDFLLEEGMAVAGKIKYKTFNPDEDIRKMINYLVIN